MHSSLMTWLVLMVDAFLPQALKRIGVVSELLYGFTS